MAADDLQAELARLKAENAALKQGAPVLGAAPRYDSDPAAQVERIFALAREYDVDLDLHLDVGDDPKQLHLYQVIELTERYKRGGRVVAGHIADVRAGRRAGAPCPEFRDGSSPP